MTVQDQILSQLAEIQRTLGTVEGAIHNLEENVTTQGTDSTTYREVLTSGLNNALTRIGTMESEIKSIKSTIEKTLKPLATGHMNMRQRVIGFVSAWSLFAAGVGILFWLFTTGFGELAKVFARVTGP